MTRAEIGKRIGEIRKEVATMRAGADSPALEAELLSILEHLYWVQTLADPTSTEELSPYDAEIGFVAN